jgi:hypothetical protein
MYEVRDIGFKGPCKTRIWISDGAKKDVDRFCEKSNPPGRFIRHLRRCAENGFGAYEGGSRPIVKPEWSGVYRIGFTWSLFRLIGFYEDPSTKADFIVIDALLKKGQSLNAADRRRIDAVARVKKDGDWIKVKNGKDHSGRYPRLAR